MDVKYPQVTVQITGGSDNAFFIIAAVSGALRREVGKQEADTYVSEATNQASYDALLAHAMATVNVR